MVRTLTGDYLRLCCPWGNTVPVVLIVLVATQLMFGLDSTVGAELGLDVVGPPVPAHFRSWRRCWAPVVCSGWCSAAC